MLKFLVLPLILFFIILDIKLWKSIAGEGVWTTMVKTWILSLPLAFEMWVLFIVWTWQ
jgi:hypothetical protein